MTDEKRVEIAGDDAVRLYELEKAFALLSNHVELLDRELRGLHVILIDYIDTHAALHERLVQLIRSLPVLGPK